MKLTLTHWYAIAGISASACIAGILVPWDMTLEVLLTQAACTIATLKAALIQLKRKGKFSLSLF